jgi:hypothetical protein
VLLEDALTLADTTYWLEMIDWQSKFLSMVLNFAREPDRKSLRPLIELYGTWAAGRRPSSSRLCAAAFGLTFTTFAAHILDRLILSELKHAQEKRRCDIHVNVFLNTRLEEAGRGVERVATVQHESIDLVKPLVGHWLAPARSVEIS